MSNIASCLTETSSQVCEIPHLKASGCFLVRIYPAGNLVENLVTLLDGTTSIGRDPDCDIQVNDDYSSRYHASLEVYHSECKVVDRGSLNGTFVNDVRVEQHVLQAGDHLRVGNHVFKYLSADHPEAQYHEAVYEIMTCDGLTRIANRRYFEDSFKRELARCLRHGRSIGVLVIDVDHFKRINDFYGHLVGDDCLKELCQRVQGAIRADDLFARLGGEEFALVLSETRATDSCIVAERIRQRVMEAPFCAGRQLNIPLTVSVGIAHSDGANLPDVEAFLGEADTWLYAAKHAGRNRVSGPPEVVANLQKSTPAVEPPGKETLTISSAAS